MVTKNIEKNKDKAKEELAFEGVRMPIWLQDSIFKLSLVRSKKAKKKVAKNTIIVEILLEKFLPSK